MYATLTRWCSLPRTNSAVCSKSYYRNTATDCIACTSSTVPMNFAIVFVFLLLFVLFVWLLRKRIQALRAKYGPAWKDIVRILTINLSYCQISSSLPSVIQVQWPVSYLNFIAWSEMRGWQSVGFQRKIAACLFCSNSNIAGLSGVVQASTCKRKEICQNVSF